MIDWIEWITWIARAQIVLDALVDEVDQITVLTDQNRYKKITLRKKRNMLSKHIFVNRICSKMEHLGQCGIAVSVPANQSGGYGLKSRKVQDLHYSLDLSFIQC